MAKKKDNQQPNENNPNNLNGYQLPNPEDQTKYTEVDADKAFEMMKTLEPARDVSNMPPAPGSNEEDASDERDPTKPRSLSDSMDSMEDLTDLQFAIRKLFPENLGNKVQNAVMVARVTPEAELPLLSIMVTDDVMSQDPKKPLNTDLMLIKNYALVSIGRDGMGRIDLGALVGAAREEKRWNLQNTGGLLAS